LGGASDRPKMTHFVEIIDKKLKNDPSVEGKVQFKNFKGIRMHTAQRNLLYMCNVQ